MALVFIYGTLKRGHVNAPLMKGANFKGEVLTQKNIYTMSAVTDHTYPYPMLRTSGVGFVKGELYEMNANQITFLDEFEGEEYERRPIALQNSQSALAYFAKENQGSPFIVNHPQIHYDPRKLIFTWIQGDF